MQHSWLPRSSTYPSCAPQTYVLEGFKRRRDALFPNQNMAKIGGFESTTISFYNQKMVDNGCYSFSTQQPSIFLDTHPISRNCLRMLHNGYVIHMCRWWWSIVKIHQKLGMGSSFGFLTQEVLLSLNHAKGSPANLLHVWWHIDAQKMLMPCK